LFEAAATEVEALSMWLKKVAAIEHGVCSMGILCVGLTARRADGLASRPNRRSTKPIQWQVAGKRDYDRPPVAR
jgi:hypothetical protein